MWYKGIWMSRLKVIWVSSSTRRGALLWSADGKMVFCISPSCSFTGLLYIAVGLKNFIGYKNINVRRGQTAGITSVLSPVAASENTRLQLSACNYFHALSSFLMHCHVKSLSTSTETPSPKIFSTSCGNTHGVVPVKLRGLTLLPLKTKAKPFSLHWDHDWAQ